LPPLPTQARGENDDDDRRENDHHRMRSLRVSPKSTRNIEFLFLLLLLLLDENNNNEKKKKKKKKNDVALLCRWMSTRARDSALEEAPSVCVYVTEKPFCERIPDKNIHAKG
jgi:hypothetical protein